MTENNDKLTVEELLAAAAPEGDGTSLVPLDLSNDTRARFVFCIQGDHDTTRTLVDALLVYVQDLHDRSQQHEAQQETRRIVMPGAH